MIKADTDTFNAVWDFLSYRNLTSNLVMFGETWSNSNAYCNADVNKAYTKSDQNLTQWMVSGYQPRSLCLAQQAGCTAGISPSVVFRPWDNATVQSSVCETPLPVGVGQGPFKQPQ